MSTSDEKQKWFACEVTVVPAAVEAAEHALNELDALGTEINHLRRTSAEAVTVIGYFHELPSDDALNDELARALGIYDLERSAIVSTSHREVVDQDWLSEWKKHWQPSEIGRFVVAPPWSEVDDRDRIVIRIEPNMAFGTGTHETTQLCLAAIEANYDPADSFLDVGTGTGILAIAAAKLGDGSAEIVACDTDLDSVSIARENAILNGVAERIRFFDGSIDAGTHVFAFVCANLTIDVIVRLLDLLLAKSSRSLLLSGILAEQRPVIEAELAARGQTDLTVEQAGEWISVLVAR
ncbi:MAG: 50S ribosomal protein L11 methyltransferase [Pyrinomonadaceae bacterium]